MIPHNRYAVRQRLHGAVILTVCFLLFFLLGFVAIAFDLGRLFIVKTELQTAMDSCALAAAQELDGQAGALGRARRAGATAANLNRVNLQSASWDGKGQLQEAGISFRDQLYLPTTSAASARYAQCQHTQTGVRMWLLHAMGAFSGDRTANPATRAVLANAVATRGSAQSTCPIPVAIRPKPCCSAANNYGFLVGEWMTVLDKGGAPSAAGEMSWYNLDGSKNASETAAELEEGGRCGTRLGDTLGTPGAQTSVDRPWNQRFGVYKNNDSPSVNHPDQSGYSYTAANWKNAVPQNAFGGTPAAGSHPSAQNYITKRAAWASLADTGTNIKSGSQIAFGDANRLNSFQKLATPGSAGEHRQYGASRRLAIVPVINSAARVIDFACMFMLHPLSGPHDPARLEFRGLAGAAGSPCAPGGMPGGAAGPLVPVLVR
ncbi:Tad domain-containing protein [Massilia antarctica]|uniref:Tad domain-containing protein n=1 Tax=Massilia antarctica TaxID=2765360 RepID=UPI0006BB55D4|nr:Tad domain-containing protein [Massilia sp. H27-R4]MCY0914934.1 Tad domain-containing protein [Massilia sp. H27-R4]CUI06899.1 Von Willebrand factor type A domain protein, associated with Flp pilus assembly [Janthinobacterium sp. CG23_2]CUU30685.1 Von Willebrand factor type A domain protein, associated with Flp pilus assembly [Janthinobacterium sp. CG23_2]